MKHVVFLVGSYHHFYSAVGNCVERVISILKNDFYISVICFKNSFELKNKDKYDSYNIYRIETRYQRSLNFWRNSSHKNKFHIFRNIAIFFIRIINLLKFLSRPQSIDTELIDCFSNELEKLNKAHKIDAVVPVVFPFESVMAAINFKTRKSSNCILLPYLFDGFSGSPSLHRFNINRKIKFKNNKKLEIIMLKTSDKIFSMHSLKDHFNSEFSQPLLSKITYLEHPLLIKPSLASKRNDKEGISFTYAGSLIRGVRSSDGCLALFYEISKKNLIKVNFYCFGNDSDAIYQYSKKAPHIFNNFGKVQQNEVKKAISCSDFLISIGDIEGKQISSKIFDYLSTGKPIIHFAYVQDCINIELLRPYPLAHIVLLENKFHYEQSVINNTIAFIKKFNGMSLSFSDVQKIYPQALPKSTANLFKNFINNSPS